MNPFLTLASLLAISTTFNCVAQAILVQPHNYMLDDSSLFGHHQDGGSLSPFYNDQSVSSEQAADRDIVSAIGQGLEKLRLGRASMLGNQQEDSEPSLSHFSAEMADLIQNEQQHQSKQDDPASLSSSITHVLMNVAQAAADAANSGNTDESQVEPDSASPARGASILELDTSAASSSASSMPSKSDLKSGPIQWYNPKETIPVLKISSMATPSKYKKVYFRSEKKLVDGAFHSPSNSKDEKRSLKRAFISGVQRRSSRATSPSSAPPGIFQDGFVEFLKKFRDVYVQTRPAVASAAGSPLASVLASPSSSYSRPSLVSAMGAISAAASKVNSASSGSNSAGSSALASAASNTVNAVVSAGSNAAAGSPIKSPFSAQTYVSFWSKTFPTWVRKMLKQMRRRSLYNSSKRQQHLSHQSHSSIGQAAQAAANVASAVEHAASGSSSSSSGR